MAIQRVAIFVIFSAWCVWITGGLKCLQCMDPKEGGPCVHDYMGLVNASLEIFPNGSRRYYKECLDGSNGIVNDYCVIETFYVGGELKSFIRDCSDGSNFSFTDEVTNTKLTQISPDNYTTCIYSWGKNGHICVTLCQGDFCNAPLPPNDTDACNDTGDNATCGAGALFVGPGPFGPMVDRVVGRAYFLPVLVAILCVQIFA